MEIKKVVYEKIPETIKEAMEWKTDAFNLKNGITYHFRKTTGHYLICGCLLNEANNKQIWRNDGSNAANFLQWVENEMGFKRSQVQRMMQIWASLKPIIEKQLELILQIDFSKLALIAPYIVKLDEEKQEELLHSARELSVKDLERNLKESNGGVSDDNCDHVNTEEWLRCRRCGKFIRKEK